MPVLRLLVIANCMPGKFATAFVSATSSLLGLIVVSHLLFCRIPPGTVVVVVRRSQRVVASLKVVAPSSCLIVCRLL